MFTVQRQISRGRNVFAVHQDVVGFHFARLKWGHHAAKNCRPTVAEASLAILTETLDGIPSFLS
jgi:hypothetical protein